MPKKTKAVNVADALQELDKLSHKLPSKSDKLVLELKECLAWAVPNASAYFNMHITMFNAEGKKAFRKWLKRCGKVLK